MGHIHQQRYCIILFLYQILFCLPTFQATKAFSTKIQLGIGDHVDIRCSDFSQTHRDGDLFWVKASSQLNPIQRGKCTDCIAYTVTNEDDKVSMVKQQSSEIPEFLPNRNRKFSGNGNYRGVFSSEKQSSGNEDNKETVLSSKNLLFGNSSTLHLTVYQYDDFGTYYCKQRTGTGLRDNKNLLAIQIIPRDKSHTNCQRDQILAYDPRKKLHKPQCNKDGSFSKIQRKEFNGDQLFWCVDKIYGIRKGHFTSNQKQLRCYEQKEAISSLAAVMIIVSVQVIFIMFDLIIYMKYDDGIFITSKSL